MPDEADYDPSAERSELLDTICTSIQAKHGTSKALSLDDLSETYHLGIKVPFLFQYLLTVNVLPLNIIMMLRGPMDSGKTCLAIMIGKWIQQSGGTIVFIDAEHKFPSDIARSLLGEEGVEPSKLKIFRVMDASEAQSVINNHIAAFKRANKAIREHNETAAKEDYWQEYCAIIILDSLPAALPDEEIKKIEKLGYTSRSVAPYARTWGKATAKFSADLADSNVILVIINHERQNIDTFGVSTPGGSQVRYQMSIDLRCSPVSSAATTTDELHPDRNKKIIRLNIKKNSGGAPNRSFEGLVLRWDLHRNIELDIDAASAQLLKDYLADSGEPLGPLKDLKLYRRYWSSESLKLKSAPAAELMQVIESNKEIMDAIRRAFGIIERPVFGREAES